MVRMAGSALRNLLSTGAATLMALLLVVGCDDDPSSGDAASDGGAEFTQLKRDLLGDISRGVIHATYEEFVTAAEALESATEAHAVDPSASNREAAQAAWREASAVWQRAEVMLVGPAGMTDVVAGGMDMRDPIYSWPLRSTCRIDQETEERAYENVDEFAGELVNVRGLNSMEYLLFVEGFDHSCASTSVFAQSGRWDALSEGSIRNQRAGYAHTLATLVARRARELETAWDPSGGDFVAQMAGAGNDSSTFDDVQTGLNAVSDAMFYLDTETKDMKLALPAGISAECAEEICPESLESPFAQGSLANLQANLAGFRALYEGNLAGETEGVGFDDLLEAVGAGDLRADMDQALDNTEAAFAAITISLAEALDSSPALVTAAHTALSELTRLLKTDFVTVLDLEIPDRAAGDND